MTQQLQLPLAAALLSALSGSLWAESAAYLELDPVVVTATRTAQPLSQAASSISVVKAKDIEETVPQTFTDTLLDIPNVDVESSSSVMFSRIRIRGSEPNQITYLVDGLRQDDTTAAGNQFIGIFIDPELLKQVEVKRGGGSSLYGNGGIGGTLSVTTKSAADFLAGTDKNYGVKVKTGYASDTKEWQKSAYVFGRHDIWDVLVGVNRRDSGNVKNSSGRRIDNNSDAEYTSVIAKVSALPTDEMAFSLAYNFDEAQDEWGRQDRWFYKNKQNRITGKWDFNSGPLLNLSAAVQYVDSTFSFDSGIKKAKNNFNSIGGNLQNTFEFSAAGQHALTVGGDIYKKSQSGVEADNTGHWVNAPSRPDSDAVDAGLFIQDQYAITDYLALTPVLRWNYYKRESNTGFASVSDSKFTPGLTLTVKPAKPVSLWASVNTGYRPPILDELYFSMVWPGTHTVVVPNPDLKPEKSLNYEAGSSFKADGVFGSDDHLFAKAVFFYDDVKDFIAPKAWLEPTTPPTLYYSSQNVGHVVRKGIELSGTYAAGQFSTSVSYGLLHAVDKETNERMNGITPQSANLKLAYAFPAQAINVWYRAHWSKGGESSVEDRATGKKLHFSSFLTHSLGAEWSPKVADLANLQAGIAAVNLFDKEYRMLNGSYGSGRGVRLWLSAQF